jgi:tetratricopeptide (TPR) repeat protein
MSKITNPQSNFLLIQGGSAMKHLSLFLINKVAEWRGLWRLFAYLLIGLLVIGCAERVNKMPPGGQVNKMNERMSYDEERAEERKVKTSYAGARQMNKINTPMSYAEARQVLTRVWESLKPYFSTEQIDQLHVSFIGKDKVELYVRTTYNDEYGVRTYHINYRFNLAEMSDPYIKTRDFWHDFNGFKVVVDSGVTIDSNSEYVTTCEIHWGSKSDADDFSNALYVLKQYAIKERMKLASEASSFADFREKARAWRTLPVKPALPEDVRRCRLLAEDAFQNKEFEKAVDYYEQGLEIEPLWPQGQYNAALLYGEIKDYENAVSHMKRYLELAPDASDAQLARDQLMIWQSKMKQ